MRITSTRYRFGRVALALATSLPVLLATSGSVSAGTSEMEIEIKAGSLGISVPIGTVELGEFTNVIGGGELTGSLGEVTVSDARSAAAGAGWVVSAISTAFTPFAGPTLAASEVGYSAEDTSMGGTATYEWHNPSDLTGVVPVVTATAITGDNWATWNPEITVNVPEGTVAGVYTATITHSVL
jgi:hypothetical protein